MPGPLFKRLTTRLLGDDAAEQVERRIDDPACGAGCSIISGEAELILTVGVNGARQITFGPPQ